jgi:4-phytase / acid phosphatase
LLRNPLKVILCRVRPSRWMLLAALTLAVLIPELAWAQYTLERVVLVSRHGVRSPTNTSPPLAEIASQTWPTWLVASPGDLTPRGESLATLMGEYYRRHFAALGLQSANGCPGQNEVYVWADVDQRTRHTGNGLLAGAFPGCGLYAQHLHPTNQIDPLFHPVGFGVCKVEKDRARDEILKAAGGSLEHALRQQPYSGALKKLQGVLGCCSPKLCQAPGGTCTLEQVRSSIVEKGNSVGLSGPISIGSTAAEVFLLEYAQDMHHVAWGHVSSQTDIAPLMWLHSLQFDLLERTHHLARRQGSALLHQVFETLRQTADRTSTPQDQVPPESKLVIYVGHDTNLANIGGMLGVHWDLKNYLRDETPPAGAMAFELLRRNNKPFVRMSYYSQSPDQMRNATRPSPTQPPDRAEIAPRCKNSQDGACPWHEFHDWVRQSVDLDCTLPTRR